MHTAVVAVNCVRTHLNVTAAATLIEEQFTRIYNKLIKKQLEIISGPVL